MREAILPAECVAASVWEGNRCAESSADGPWEGILRAECVANRHRQGILRAESFATGSHPQIADTQEEVPSAAVRAVRMEMIRLISQR